MKIEELFGTLQMSVVSGWRKHLRSAKYGKHVALQEFYEEMPDKVDALIEAWMGANGKKVGNFTNTLTSSNMNTLSYLKELKKVCKDGYDLLDDNEELESLLDDIVNLINSTLYKVKELNESRVIPLTEFINEALISEGLKRKPTISISADDFETSSNRTEVAINISKKLAEYASSKQIPKNVRGIMFTFDNGEFEMRFIDSNYRSEKISWYLRGWKLESKSVESAQEEIINFVNHMLSNDKAFKEFMEWNIQFRDEMDSNERYGSVAYINNGEIKFKYNNINQGGLADHYLKWLDVNARPLSSLLNIK
jgi:hypothetical protein